MHYIAQAYRSFPHQPPSPTTAEVYFINALPYLLQSGVSGAYAKFLTLYSLYFSAHGTDLFDYLETAEQYTDYAQTNANQGKELAMKGFAASETNNLTDDPKNAYLDAYYDSIYKYYASINLRTSHDTGSLIYAVTALSYLYSADFFNAWSSNYNGRAY
jgi:hypothetical protein